MADTCESQQEKSNLADLAALSRLPKVRAGVP